MSFLGNVAKQIEQNVEHIIDLLLKGPKEDSLRMLEQADDIGMTPAMLAVKNHNVHVFRSVVHT
jgi:hypothetical protein